MDRIYKPIQRTGNRTAPINPYSNSYRKKQKKSPLKPISKILGISILATGLSLAGDRAYHFLENYVKQHETPTVQTAPEIQSSSPTRYMDAITALDIESLDICRPAKNLGHLLQKKERFYTTVDSVNSTNPTQLPFAFAAAIPLWEAGEENSEKNLSWFRERPDRKFVNFRGAIGKWGITPIAIDDYNRRHPRHKIDPDSAWAYIPNTMLGIERLVTDLEHRDGDFTLTDLDYVSGRRTTNYLLGNHKTLEGLSANLWNDDSDPVPNKNWKKRITQPMLDQAQVHPNEVAVLTYLVDTLVRSAGLDPEKDIAENLRPGYRRFVSHGEHMYSLAEKEHLEGEDDDRSTVENPLLSRYFENRLRQENMYTEPLLATNEQKYDGSRTASR